MSLYSEKISQWVLVYCGLSIYSLSPLVRFYIPTTVSSVVELVGFLVLIYAYLKGNFRGVKGDDSTLLKVFLSWTIFMLLRGDIIGNFLPGVNGFGGAIATFIFNGSAGLAYFIPFIILMPIRLDSFYSFRRIGLVLCCISLVLVGINWEEIVLSSAIGMTDLEMASGSEASIRDASRAFLFIPFLVVFLAFCHNYYKGLIKVVFPIYLLVYFYVQSLGGGRGGTLLALLYIVCFIFIFYKYPLTSTAGRKTNKWSVRIMALAALAGFVYVIVYMIQNNAFDYLIHRFDEGASNGSYLVAYNREVLRRDLIADFNDNPISWIIGRGVNGAFATKMHATNGMRDGIEYGYLHFVLKGGIPYLLMYVYLLLHCAYPGLFKSKNLLCKSMAFYCIVNFIALYTATGPEVSHRYFLVWVSICLLERKNVRMLSDAEIYNFMNEKYGNTNNVVLKI